MAALMVALINVCLGFLKIIYHKNAFSALIFINQKSAGFISEKRKRRFFSVPNLINSFTEVGSSKN